MKEYDLIIIGDGISSKVLTYYLCLQQRFLKNIAVVSNSDMAPPCSLATTSIVSLFGTQKGLSDLGDLNVDSFMAFDSFVKKNNPKGVHPAEHFHLNTSDSSALVKRFGHAQSTSQLTDEITLTQNVFVSKDISHVVYAQTFMDWIDRETSKSASIKVDKINYHVRSISYQNNSVVLNDGNLELKAKNIVLCSGAYSKINEAIYPKQKAITHSKVVSGSYLGFKDIDWGNRDLIFTLNKMNLIYRHHDRSLLLGGTHCTQGISIAYERQLKASFEAFQKLLSLPWPSYDQGMFYTGLRHKGQKRMPFYGKLEERVYAQIGLYKNGFSYPFFMAPKLIEQIKNDLDA